MHQENQHKNRQPEQTADRFHSTGSEEQDSQQRHQSIGEKHIVIPEPVIPDEGFVLAVVYVGLRLCFNPVNHRLFLSPAPRSQTSSRRASSFCFVSSDNPIKAK